MNMQFTVRKPQEIRIPYSFEFTKYSIFHDYFVYDAFYENKYQNLIILGNSINLVTH